MPVPDCHRTVSPARDLVITKQVSRNKIHIPGSSIDVFKLRKSIPFSPQHMRYTWGGVERSMKRPSPGLVKRSPWVLSPYQRFFFRRWSSIGLLYCYYFFLSDRMRSPCLILVREAPTLWSSSRPNFALTSFDYLRHCIRNTIKACQSDLAAANGSCLFFRGVKDCHLNLNWNKRCSSCRWLPLKSVSRRLHDCAYIWFFPCDKSNIKKNNPFILVSKYFMFFERGTFISFHPPRKSRPFWNHYRISFCKWTLIQCLNVFYN